MSSTLICPTTGKPCDRGCNPADGPCDKAVTEHLDLVQWCNSNPWLAACEIRRLTEALEQVVAARSGVERRRIAAVALKAMPRIATVPAIEAA